jgi:Protein of unknown function (DUF3631)
MPDPNPDFYDPDDGPALLDDLRRTLTKYVVLSSPEAVDATVLWIAVTHGLPAFEHATRLCINSPVKRCGKSRLLELIKELAHNTVPTTNISVPALFRLIDKADVPPTLLLDEADRLFGSAKKDEENRDLIAILNNGFRDGSPTYRCVGPTQIPTPFSNYAMAALAGIGRKPDTIEDRSVCITMRRRMPGENVAKFRLSTDVPALRVIRDRLADWVASAMDVLSIPVTSIPDGLEDRAEDAWEPMLAVADAAGGSWPTRARTAALKLTREASTEDEEQSFETRILADVRGIFADRGDTTFIPTADLLTQLRKLEESPWADDNLTSRGLADWLRKFGVKSKRNTAGTARGYRLRDLQDSFGQYLPSEPSKASETQAEQEERSDASESSDGLTRQNEISRQGEFPVQRVNLTGLTVLTDTPDGRSPLVPTLDAPCPICQAPAPSNGSFGTNYCAHQIAAGLAPA